MDHLVSSCRFFNTSPQKFLSLVNSMVKVIKQPASEIMCSLTSWYVPWASPTPWTCQWCWGACTKMCEPLKQLNGLCWHNIQSLLGHQCPTLFRLVWCTIVGEIQPNPSPVFPFPFNISSSLGSMVGVDPNGANIQLNWITWKKLSVLLLWMKRWIG